MMRWIRKHLFATPIDAALTLLVGWIIWIVVSNFVEWAVLDATWNGTTRDACQGRDGACWVFIRMRFMQFMYGFYPSAERWRVNVAFLLLAVGCVPFFIEQFRWKRLQAVLMLTVFPVIFYLLVHGGAFGLEPVETQKWGGLMVTLIIAITGILVSLPLGILLALGRRSSLPVINKLCIAFIELWRGVPLITVLFMASIMLPLFLPEGMTFDKLLRALVGASLFASAYMAEVIRGGLQAIPRGQYEAASALGLPYWRTHAFVILPQALRQVIPGIVNTFIGLFKDTTLVMIIGMFDLLGIVQAALTDPAWLGYSMEGYAFVGLVFWVFCFSMSRLSARFERRYAWQRR